MTEPDSILPPYSQRFDVLSVEFTVPQATFIHVGASGALTDDGRFGCDTNELGATNRLLVRDAGNGIFNSGRSGDASDIIADTILVEPGAGSGPVTADMWVPAGTNHATIFYDPWRCPNGPVGSTTLTDLHLRVLGY